ncbi:uncharacterized protein [Euwallacea fornicatus]|uniref:uncharacterized protein isoform X2 n=1 Tax=Euwallacea fornicatus TaxID=995702 RepID=UPI0033901F87
MCKTNTYSSLWWGPVSLIFSTSTYVYNGFDKDFITKTSKMDYKCASFVVLCAILAVCSAVTYQYMPGIEYEGEIFVPLSAISNVRVSRAADPRHHGQGKDVAQSQANAAAESFRGSANAAASAQGGFSFPNEGGNLGHRVGGYNRNRGYGERNNGFGGGPFRDGVRPNAEVFNNGPTPFGGGAQVGGFNARRPPFSGGFGGGTRSDAGANAITGGFNGGHRSGGGGSQPNADANAVAGNGVRRLPQGSFNGLVPGGTSAGASGGSSADANAQTQTFVGNGFTATSSSASSSSRSDGFGRSANSVANANAVALG